MLHAFGDVRLTRPVDVEDRVEARAVPVEEDGGGVAGEDVVAVAEGVLQGGGSEKFKEICQISLRRRGTF